MSASGLGRGRAGLWELLDMIKVMLARVGAKGYCYFQMNAIDSSMIKQLYRGEDVGILLRKRAGIRGSIKDPRTDKGDHEGPQP